MIGKTISHYKIIEKLGEGGMGVVYRAEDTKLKRTVALKFLASRALGTEDDRIRFMNEAQAAAALNHPNICTIHEINESDGQSFIVMEYLEGRSLESIIKSGQIPREEALDIASQMAEGLSEAHRLGIVHRDIKPANIMITGSNRVKIMDFGLASAPGGSKLTKEGTTLGTVAYMSPEQTRGGSVDHRADIWAFGVILYQMLTGRLPFKGDYDQAIIYSILNEDPLLLPESIASIPVGLEAVIERALKKDPKERYHNLGDLLKDLSGSAGTLKKGKTSGSREPASGRGVPVRRKALYIAGALIILIATVLAVSRFLPEQREDTIESIAVLPLKNLSGDPDQEYISDGMTESLITELSQIRSLKIISRTSVMRYKDTDKSLPEIARELGADAVIEGSAILVGEKIRITAQLIEAKSDRHLWAQDFDREFKDVLSLQKEVAISVVRQIKAVLTPEEEAELAAGHAVDPEMQKLYLRGRYHIGILTVSDQNRGIEFMKQVIDRSPDYGLAYVSIAEAYNNLIVLGGVGSAEGWEESKKWAEQALEIDDSLGEAYLMIADVKALHEWDWVGAEDYYRRCLELNPGSVTGHLWYATYLKFIGRYEEARKLIERSEELSPNEPGVMLHMADVYDRLGDKDKAVKVCRDAIDIFPEFGHSYFFLSEFYLEQSRFDEAESVLRDGIAVSVSAIDSFRLAPFYARAGMDEKAEKLLEEMLALRNDELTGYIALVYVQLGEMDSAFVWLEKAYKARNHFLVLIYSGDGWAPLRKDPRYPDLCRRIGFPGCQ